MNNEILVIAEHRQGSVTEATQQVIAAACELSKETRGSIVVALAAHKPETLVQQVSVAGIHEVVLINVPSIEFNSDEIGTVLTAIIQSRMPRVVLGHYSVNLSSIGPRLALRGGLGFASDVTSVYLDEGDIVATRMYYGGKVSATLEFPEAGAVLLLRPGDHPLPMEAGSPTISCFSTPPGVSRVTHIDLIDPPLSELDISKAEVVLAVGRGVGEKENLEKFEILAEQLGVTFASSRPLVDAGWMPKFRQVGQSGVTVKPRLYIAMGISGAVQHIAGMKGSDTILAVNTDPQAPIFEFADFGAVEDIFEVADEIRVLL